MSEDAKFNLDTMAPLMSLEGIAEAEQSIVEFGTLSRERMRELCHTATVAHVLQAELETQNADAGDHLSDAAADLYEALSLFDAYEAVPRDRGGEQGPKGTAWRRFVEAKNKALAKAQGGDV